jgi:hypothetical protein
MGFLKFVALVIGSAAVVAGALTTVIYGIIGRTSRQGQTEEMSSMAPQGTTPQATTPRTT